ncbi:MAG: hypothetical protein R3Y19_00795 [Rikenellaceae bacterium]
MSNPKLHTISQARSIIPRWGLLTSLVVIPLSCVTVGRGEYLRMVDMHPGDMEQARMVDFVGAQFKFVSHGGSDVDLLLRVERSLEEPLELVVKVQTADGRYLGDTVRVNPLHQELQVPSNRTSPLRELRIKYLREANFATDTMLFSIRATQQQEKIKNIGLHATSASEISSVKPKQTKREN